MLSPLRSAFAVAVSVLLGLALTPGCSAPVAADTVLSPVAADLVLKGGRIATVDPKLGDVEALAVRDGRIAAAGTWLEIAPLVAASTTVIELDGRLAIPGFIEGHAHFTGIGEAAQILDLTSVRNWDEIIGMVEQATAQTPPGTWILGRGWHQEKWDQPPLDNVEGFPTHGALSEVSSSHPVLLKHASGHAAFANAKAMDLAGIDRSTPDPAGGELLRGPGGTPTGVLRETAQALVGRLVAAERARLSPAEREAALEHTLRLADRECLSKGVTSFQDAGTSLATLAGIRRLVERGELDVRLWIMVRDSNENLRAGIAAARVVGAAGDHLTVRALKRSLDGALGSRGAWLLEPYADAPDSTGLATATIASVEETARIALEHDLSLCVHAIGDRANRETLDLFERALGDANRIGDDHRWRVEHAQHLSRADIPRFAQLGVIASMQAVHCTSDAPYVRARLGEARAREGAYVWRSLIDSGAVVTNGTDAPVEDVDPLPTFHAAVTRRLADDSTFFPEQVMTRRAALESATIRVAYAAFEDDLKGSLTPGKLADIVVLSKDILNVPAEELLDARVDLTIVGGEIVYRRAIRH